MKTVIPCLTDINDIPSRFRGAVVVLGNFDGVHRGHQALMATARKIADDKGVSVVVLTFDPHPQTFFSKKPIESLTSLAQKIEYLADCGVDAVVAIPFTADFAAMSPADFMNGILVKHLSVVHVVTGWDFTFGKDRQGRIADLAQHPEFGATAVPPVRDYTGEVISSTRIRALIKDGDLQAAADLLGRPWTLSALVIHGDKRGRTIGYPTANQRVDDYVHPPYGVYAVQAVVAGEETIYHGAASFGIRPMFEVDTPLLETFIFDFDRDIYAQDLKITPVAYLRPEMKFDTLDTLIEQIQADCSSAKDYLKEKDKPCQTPM